MTDVLAVAEVLVRHAVEKGKGEVDLVGIYGSRARGDHREGSDLDIFYVPSDGREPPVGRTFLLEGQLYDFWAIPWDMLEGFATGRMRGWAFAPGLVAHAKVLYARTPNEAARLERVTQMVRDLQKPKARQEMVDRALVSFGRVMAHLGNARLAAKGGDIVDVRFAGWMVVQSALECLALVNQTFFDCGLGKALADLGRLARRPRDLERLVAAVATSPDLSEVVEASEELALGTRRVLREAQATLPSRTTVQEEFRASYPELKDAVGKVRAACGRGDRLAAAAAAWALHVEVAGGVSRTQPGGGRADFNLYSELAVAVRSLGFPDLVAAMAAEPDQLAQAARSLDERLRQWLPDQGVNLHEFGSLEELKRALSSTP